MHLNAQSLGGADLHVTVAGIVTNSGVFASINDFLVLAVSDYQQAMGNRSVFYDTIDVTAADKAHVDEAVKAISQQFPLSSVTTVDQAFKANQDQVAVEQKFLALVGLLALLIGGIGIVHTMQVLLARRRLEIATLKTVGYHQGHLLLLFGLEAGLLGLAGGTVGALLAIGLSALVRGLVQQLSPMQIPFVIDPLLVLGGLLVGVLTALIFGLLPIVKAAHIRPLSVLRDEPDSHHVRSALLTCGLILVLSLLFWVMAGVILKDSLLAGGVVYGGLVVLGLLVLLFGFVLLAVSKLPVPERFNLKQGVLVVLALLIAVLLVRVLPAFGGLVLLLALLGAIVAFLPVRLKVSLRMALSHLNRQRARTSTTLLALFIGVVAIGLILVLRENLTDLINRTVANNMTFNAIAIAQGSEADRLASGLSSIPGLQRSARHLDTRMIPLSIDGVPLQQLIPANASFGYQNLGASAINYLNGLEGYDVAQNQLPDTSQILSIVQGRNLNSSDVGSCHVLLNDHLLAWLPLKGHVHLGSTLILSSLDGKVSRSCTVVGTYLTRGLEVVFNPVLTTSDVVQALAVGGVPTSIYYLRIDPAHLGQAFAAIGQEAPDVAVFNLANTGDYLNRYLGQALSVVLAVALLSLLAATVIIANAVALAMLERRREMGILKALGYTSEAVLSEVLLENGLIGATGATLAMLLVTLLTSLLGQYVFKASFGVSWYLALGVIASICLLAMAVAALVAWQPVRIRPLMVLRYE
ncbi:FtsX-like permease family protein [Thermogemmatispora tikiterensis]|uniref:ABC3 transporter permease protein domain-containing protein n=1 Tax=Thermogemmatispora tikiterensis TaxID=1825093 RepID=A0A328V9J6_9CHLR|nr:ABC transporter permease [Thermogemmatispora tikiterensis]RAQ94307.1 hypothetical protein A4R35_02105 [Thermogemmatispora tikiterensis]